MTSERNQSIDALKGVLILLVVAGHVPAPPGDFVVSAVQEWIYIFHMPAFFILGSLHVKSTHQELKSISPLLFCYVFWVIVNKQNPDAIARTLLHSNWENLRSILWFIPTLISLRLILSLHYKIYWRNGIIVLLGSFTIIFQSQLQQYHHIIPWGLDIALYLLPIALIARYFYSIKISKTELLSRERIRLVFLFCFLTFSLLFFARIPENTFTAFHHKLDLAQFSVPDFEGYIYLSVMLVSIVGIARIRSRGSILSVIGNKSLSIFIFHLPLIGYINRYIFSADSHITWLTMVGFSALASCAMSALLLRVSKWFKYIGA